MATVLPFRSGAPCAQTIAVRFDRVYGVVKCYPACVRAERFARIARTKTLSPRDLEAARFLGFTVLVDDRSVAMLEAFVGGAA